MTFDPIGRALACEGIALLACAAFFLLVCIRCWPKPEEDDCMPAEASSPPTRALEVGDDVKVFSGPHAGLAGQVREMFLDYQTARLRVTIRLAGGRRVVVDRDDVERC